jgi:hypothetical protein
LVPPRRSRSLHIAVSFEAALLFLGTKRSAKARVGWNRHDAVPVDPDALEDLLEERAADFRVVRLGPEAREVL